MTRTGIEAPLTGLIQVLSNPFQDKLTITGLGSLKIHITLNNHLGRVVYQKSVYTDQPEIIIDLAHLQASVHVIKIISEADTTRIIKVIKK